MEKGPASEQRGYTDAEGLVSFEVPPESRVFVVSCLACRHWRGRRRWWFTTPHAAIPHAASFTHPFLQNAAPCQHPGTLPRPTCIPHPRAPTPPSPSHQRAVNTVDFEATESTSERLLTSEPEQFVGFQLQRICRTAAVVLDSATSEGVPGFTLKGYDITDYVPDVPKEGSKKVRGV